MRDEGLGDGAQHLRLTACSCECKQMDSTEASDALVWVCRISMGSLQSAILGFGIFRLLERSCGITGFTVQENVILQTTAVATATMPLAAGTAPWETKYVCIRLYI